MFRPGVNTALGITVLYFNISDIVNTLVFFA